MISDGRAGTSGSGSELDFLRQVACRGRHAGKQNNGLNKRGRETSSHIPGSTSRVGEASGVDVGSITGAASTVVGAIVGDEIGVA